MKKSLVVVVLLLACAPLTFATLVTNMNQSALYFRLLSRNASTDVDAVFYNPAGLMQLKNGWHFSLSNQTIFQKKTVINAFPLLNTDTYEGTVNVPLFPDFYAVYKTDNLAFSFGFGPNSGGGSADFKKGLPSFEIPFSEIPFLLTYMGIPTTQYSADIAFEGSSIFWGFQANASAAVADWVDAAVGLRVIVAHNTYTGHISDIMINPGLGSMMSASLFFSAIGQPVYAYLTADKVVDAAQDGTGFTPLLSLNFHPAEGLNIGLKYEFITKLTLTNTPTQDDLNLFPADEKVHNDIPAILSAGIDYKFTPRLRGTASFNYFFDRNADWDGRQNFVDKNSWDLGAGLEYGLTESILVSAGFLHTQFTLLPGYNSDFSHEMANDSIGFGGRVILSPSFDLDLGALLTFYNKSTKTINYGAFGSWQEEYKRSTFGLAIGVNYHI